MSVSLSDSGTYGPDHPVTAAVQDVITEQASIEETSRVFVEQLLDSTARKSSERALASLPGLSDEAKQSIAKLLTQRLPDAQESRQRSWSLSALAEINAPNTVSIIAARLDPKNEPDEWVRYWAAIALAKMQSDDLKEQLKAALDDKNALVKAVALRLLIENGCDEYVEPLLLMAQDPDWVNRKVAAKVLRSNAGHRSFTEAVENRFIPILVARLYDSYEVSDCQYQAARALGNMQHRWSDAVTALGEALKKDMPDLVRRACLDALREIGKKDVKGALLVALEDRDAEIRVQAAKTLESVLEASDALDFIVGHLLQRDQPVPHYLDALRQIDSAAAAALLADNLLHPDPKLSARASQALAHLGGERAVRALQKQQTQALDKYTEMLKQADATIMAQFDGLIDQARLAFKLSMWMHGAIFAVGIIILGVSLYVALAQGFETFERYVGVGAAAGSLGTLLLLFYKDPLENIRNSVTSLVKINVVFLGYVRQINQIDATFKQLFLASAGFGVEQMQQTVQQIQDAVDKTMSEIKTHLGPE